MMRHYAISSLKINELRRADLLICEHSPIFFIPFTSIIGRGGASQKRRLILLLSVDWVPPDWRPSGAGLSRGASMPAGSRHAVEDDTKTGAASLPMHVRSRLHDGFKGHLSIDLRVSRAPLGPWPPYSPPVLGPWPRPPGWRVDPVRSVVDRVCQGERGPSNEWLG